MIPPPQDTCSVAMKAPKRKRLAKACDACHKSKRRCDGTAPCSNCYYASKACTYTDSAGRPVPAPRSIKGDSSPSHSLPGSSTSDYRPSYSSQQPYSSDSLRYPQLGPYPPTATAPPPSSQKIDQDDRLTNRKRFRNDRGNPVSSEEIFLDGPIISAGVDRPTHMELDQALTRELTNLFFAHCHPAHAIIHKPDFSNALSHNRVPKHLLHAVCAMAAHLSKQPRLRTTPARYAGKPFAQEALSIMFDGAGRLVVQPDLATAQALALLLMHDVLTKDGSMWNTRYADLALQIVENLGVHEPDHPTLTPMPSPDFIHQSFKREAVRRIFWLIHLLDVMASIYFRKPTTFTAGDLTLRLPVDETSFELGVHSTLPEYLYINGVKAHYSSEFGHLIRVITIAAKVEYALDGMNDPETNMSPQSTLIEAEEAIESWAKSLPEHLQFSEQNLQVQRSMFETSSNMGAWCWSCMHVYHASCALALHFNRQRSQRGPKTELQWAINLLYLIMDLLGDRAKNSVLLGAILWPLVKYCNKRDDPQVRALCIGYEEAWGTNIADRAQDYRSNSSPPLQQQLTSNSHQFSTQQPATEQQTQQQHHPQRIPDSRHPASNHPPQLGSQDNSYGRRRSSSNSPGSYPLRRSLDELRLHGNIPSVNNGTRSILSMAERDGRIGSLAPGSSGNIGPNVGRGGNPVQTARVKEDDNSVGNSTGVAATNGGLNEGQRDNSQSLPSLKASGLLDSWNRDVKPHFHGNNGHPLISPPRRTPPMPSLPVRSIANDSEVRSTTSLGVPIGLPWLANDS